MERNDDKTAEPLRTAPPLSQLPWELAKDQFGGQGADFIGVMGSLLVRSTKDQFRVHLIDPTGVSNPLPPAPEKDQFQPASY